MTLSTVLEYDPIHQAWRRLAEQSPAPHSGGSEGIDLFSVPFLLGLLLGALILAPLCYYAFRALRTQRQSRLPKQHAARSSALVPHRPEYFRRDPLHDTVRDVDRVLDRTWDAFKRQRL